MESHKGEFWFAKMKIKCVQSKGNIMQKRAQHSVHWTLGILRHFRAFPGFEYFLLPNIVHACPQAGNANR